jgi:hypothetical protein
VITSNDHKSAVGNYTITYSWHQKSQQLFVIPGLILSLLFCMAALIMHLIWRSQNAKGRHSGEAKRLADIINEHTGEFALPMSSQIRNVKEFANIQEHAANQSLLPNHTLAPDVNVFEVAPPAPVNEGWRYYGEDAYSMDSSYQSAAIAHTQNFSTFGLTNQLNTSPYMSEGGFSQNLPTALPLSTEFSATAGLQAVPEHAGTAHMSRQELRKKGLLKKKKRGDK